MADGTLFCALQGTLKLHSWYDPATADVGLDPLDEGSRRLWFQVSRQQPAVPRRAVPAQQMLDCAGAGPGRVGRLDLEAAPLLVPLQTLPPGHEEGAYADLVSALPWFAELPDQTRTPVVVSLDSGTGTEAPSTPPRPWRSGCARSASRSSPTSPPHLGRTRPRG